MITRNRKFHAQRFHEAVIAFFNKTCASVEAFAALVGRPATTVYKWKEGVQCPGRSALKAICVKLNWNYEALFLRDALLDQIIDQQFLSFETLNSRYKEMRNRSAFEALTISTIAGATAFGYLTAKGLQCVYEIDPFMSGRIGLLDPDLHGGVLCISGNDADGLRIQLCAASRDESGNVLRDQLGKVLLKEVGEFQPLSEVGLDFWYGSLMTYKKGLTA